MGISDDLLDKKIKEELNEQHSKIPTEINKLFEETSSKLKYKRKSKFKKVVGIWVASLLFIVITIGALSTPAIAANIPFIDEIYRKLGLFKDFEEYTNSIGETKEVNGYTFTIDNIVGTPNKILVSVKVVSPIPLNKAAKLDNFDINISFNDIKDIGINALSRGTRTFYIDDNTAIIVGTIENMEGKFKSIGEIKFNVSKDNDASTQFNVKFNLEESFNKIYKKQVGEKINNNITVNELEASVIESRLILEKLGFGPVEEEYYLEIDGKLNREYEGTGLDGIVAIGFPTVKYDDIKNAKSVNVVSVIPEKDILNEELINTVDWANEDGVKYPKVITTKSGLKGEFYKIEKENDILRLYFESEYNPINLLSQFILQQNIKGERYGGHNLGILYKNENKENSYIFEFKDVDFEKDSEIIFWGTNTNLDKIKEVKRIKVK